MADISSNPQDNIASHSDEKGKHDVEISHTEKLAEVGANGQVLSAKWDVLKEEANKAEEYEHSFSLWGAVKEYRWVG